MPGPVAFDTPWSTDARGLTTLRRLSAITTGLCALAAAFAAPASAAPVPIVDCITPSGTDPNLRWIYFGYVNTGQQQFIDFGDANQVAPGLGYQGQPTVFNPGSYPRVFRAIYNVSGYPDGVGWTVGGTTAQATLASPRCQAGATGPVSALTPTGATLHGLVEADGAQAAHYFNYGTTIAYGQSTLERQTSSASGVLVSEPITGLLPNTTYHYRLVASSGTITTVGEDRTFTTPALPPAQVDLVLGQQTDPGPIAPGGLVTSALTVSNPGGSGATGVKVVATLPSGAVFDVPGSSAGCTLNPGGAAVTCVVGALAGGASAKVDVAYRPASSGQAATTAVAFGDQPDPALANNHASGQTRVAAVNGTTGPASDVTSTSATVNGVVEADGVPATYRFEYGATPGYGQTTAGLQAGGLNPALVARPLTGLVPGTTYHYRLLVTRGGTTVQGEDRTFTTAPAPVVPAAPEPVTVFVPGATIPVPVPAAAAAPTAADLVLMRSGPRARVRVGRTQTIRLRVTNRGPATATKAGLVARLGDGLRLVSVRGPAGRCWGRTTVRCPLGTIAAGRRIIVTLRVRATRAGRLTDTVSVTADQPEARVADNVVTGSIRARRVARRR